MRDWWPSGSGLDWWRGSGLGADQDVSLCSWAEHFPITMSTTQEYKWVYQRELSENEILRRVAGWG